MTARSIAVTLCLPLMLAGCGGEPAPRAVMVGASAPELALPTLAGSIVDSRSFDGKPVVLNFWATWCRPCRGEIPELVSLAASGRAEIIGIALDAEGERAVRPFVEEHGINYTVALGDQDVFERFHGFAIPYTLVLDGTQRVVNIYRGPTSRAELEADLDQLAGSGGAPAG